ncbi:hypothetical protein Tco_0488017 [Tanacetum coccineum]
MNRSMSVIKRRYRYSKLIHCLSECEVVTEDRDCRVNGDIMKRGLLDKLETDLPGVYDVDSDLKIDLIKSACDKYLKCCPINVAMKVAGQFDGIWAPRSIARTISLSLSNIMMKQLGWKSSYFLGNKLALVVFAIFGLALDDF